MKMKDVYAKYPELEEAIKKIDSTIKPNSLCSTQWNKLQGINNSTERLDIERQERISSGFRLNAKKYNLKNSTIGKSFQEAIHDEIVKKTQNECINYSITYLYTSNGNAYSFMADCTFIVLESIRDYNRRMQLLEVKKIFMKYIVSDLEEFTRNKKLKEQEKINLKKSFDEELKILKQKYMQK